jgi:hypothetical protein
MVPSVGRRTICGAMQIDLVDLATQPLVQLDHQHTRPSRGRLLSKLPSSETGIELSYRFARPVTRTVGALQMRGMWRVGAVTGMRESL